MAHFNFTTFCVVLLTSTATAMAQSQTGLGPAAFYSLVADGANFQTADVYTRVATRGTIGQSEPFHLQIPDVPTGREVVTYFITWSYDVENNADPPAFDTISIDGNSLTAAATGVGAPELCWFEPGTGHVVCYMAQVSSNFFSLPANVEISGATDKMFGGDRALGEGISIITVYKAEQGQTAPLRVVDLFRGYTSTESSDVPGEAQATLSFTHQYLGGPLHFYVIALDGQSYLDRFYINNVSVGGLLPGTYSADNAWAGLLGQSPTDSMYDRGDGQISSIVPNGAVDLTFKTVKDGDCIGHSFAAVSFRLE